MLSFLFLIIPTCNSSLRLSLQDQLVYAALFSSGGGGASHGGRNSQGSGWDGDASFEADLNEERVWLASREQALAAKENELSEAAV